MQVSGGFLEGIVRGYKAGLLTQNQYNNLTQCETIDGMQAPNTAVLCIDPISRLTIHQM